MLFSATSRNSQVGNMAFSRMLTGLALTVVVALTSAQTIEELQALLEAAKNKQQEEAANANPEIAVDDGNLHFRVGRNGDAK